MTDKEGVVAPLQAAEAASGGVLANILQWQEQQKRTVLCGPEVEETVRQAIDRNNLAGMFKVQASDVIPTGQIVVVNEHAIEANMRELLREDIGRPRPASYWQADYRAIVEDTWRGKFRDGPPDAAQPPSSEASPQ